MEEQDRIGGGTLLTGWLLGLLGLVLGEVFMVLTNCNEMMPQKEMLPEVRSLFQPDSNMVNMNVQAESPNKASWEMSLPLQSSRFCCLRKKAICYKEQTMLQTSLWRNLLVLKRNMDLNLPSQRLGSAGTLALYRIMARREGSVKFLY